jgi:DNA-binding GntR family transcriptional regulator
VTNVFRAPGRPDGTAALLEPTTLRPRRPLSDEIRDAIAAELILSGAVPAGRHLPTEAELCKRYRASRATVRAALRSLREAGYISTRHGLGSLVLPRPSAIRSGIDQLCSFETFAAEQGGKVETTDLEIEEVSLDPRTAGILAVPPESRALVIRRAKIYDGVRVGWIVDYVIDGVLPFATIINEFDGSVLDVLLNHEETEVEYSDCDIVPLTLDAGLARRLAARRGSAALFLNELTRTRSGRIVNWSQAWLLPEHFRFFVRRRRQFDSRG